MPVRILIVDDHEAVRRGLRSVLATQSGLQVCGEAVDGVDAVEKAKALRPNIVLMDMSMPRMDGVEATRIIRKEVPESEVIVVSQNDPRVVSRQASELDAAGFVPKDDIAFALLPLIDEVSHH